MEFKKAIATLGLATAIFASEKSSLEARAGDAPIINNSIIFSSGQGIPIRDRLDFDLNSVKKYGFENVYKLKKDEAYKGNADNVILVWSSKQLIEAEQYRKSHYPGLKTDIAVCEDPKVQRKQLEKRSVIYHYQ
ncbi:Uncharacterised protein [uncultured archaeon]|nr:Uncharacterised protein [uncultured archaeon]